MIFTYTWKYFCQFVANLAITFAPQVLDLEFRWASARSRQVAQGRMTVGHAGPVLTRGSGAKAKAKPKAAQGKCFAGDSWSKTPQKKTREFHTVPFWDDDLIHLFFCVWD